MHNLEKWNGKPVLTSEPDIVLETDASLLGWDARCKETSTGGLWNPGERNHINCLELLGWTLAVKAFDRCSHPSKDEQHHGHTVHQQDGWYKVVCSFRDGLQSLKLVPGKRCLPLGGTPSRYPITGNFRFS